MKPDWKDAPEWANWLAKDEQDDWCWYEIEPIPDVGGWWWSSGSHQYCDLHADDWKDSLEKRPNAD